MPSLPRVRVPVESNVPVLRTHVTFKREGQAMINDFQGSVLPRETLIACGIGLGRVAVIPQRLSCRQSPPSGGDTDERRRPRLCHGIGQQGSVEDHDWLPVPMSAVLAGLSTKCCALPWQRHFPRPRTPAILAQIKM